MRTKKIAVFVSTSLLVGSMVGLAAEPANASPAWTQYCAAHMYTDNAWTTTPTQGMWCRVQVWGEPYGYNVTVDGIPGSKTWTALQRGLSERGFAPGTIDGVPGPNTYKAMQRFAKAQGYTGPIDGVMGPNSWHYFSLGIWIQMKG